MIYCGIKFTHDSSISLIKNNRLLCCIEAEKLNNNFRHMVFRSDFPKIFEKILKDQNLTLDDIDYFSIDGWSGQSAFGSGNSFYSKDQTISIKGQQETIDWYYNNQEIFNSINTYRNFQDEAIVKKTSFLGRPCLNFTHVYNHLLSSYCSSPFSKNKEPSYILVFDGGAPLSLYYFNGTSFEFKERLLECTGSIYQEFFEWAGILKNKNVSLEDLIDKVGYPGKIMAYASLGQINIELKNQLESRVNWVRGQFESAIDIIKEFSNVSSEDILATLCFSLEEIIIKQLKFRNIQGNLCLAGGSFLNICWNTSIRNLKDLSEVWAPPFINDSGSSIGAACAARFLIENTTDLIWNVYSGPLISSLCSSEGWLKQECGVPELAKFLFLKKGPVVVLHDRAEIGPRALGNRSILCDASVAKNKDILNKMKKREWYRPIAPVCLEDEAEKYFRPGKPDPYMLFEHMATEKAYREVPSVIHLDGTCRLQTLNKQQNPLIYDILKNYQKVSGIPILCNTSANNSGKGFFPDIISAQQWCEKSGCNYIWSEGFLFIKKGSLI